MSKVEGTNSSPSPRERPNAQRFGGIGSLGPDTELRTVSVASAVFVLAVS
jgi:hypothetical protein